MGVGTDLIAVLGEDREQPSRGNIHRGVLSGAEGPHQSALLLYPSRALPASLSLLCLCPTCKSSGSGNILSPHPYAWKFLSLGGRGRGGLREGSRGAPSRASRLILHRGPLSEGASVTHVPASQPGLLLSLHPSPYPWGAPQVPRGRAGAGPPSSYSWTHPHQLLACSLPHSSFPTLRAQTRLSQFLVRPPGGGQREHPGAGHGGAEPRAGAHCEPLADRSHGLRPLVQRRVALMG